MPFIITVLAIVFCIGLSLAVLTTKNLSGNRVAEHPASALTGLAPAAGGPENEAMVQDPAIDETATTTEEFDENTAPTALEPEPAADLTAEPPASVDSSALAPLVPAGAPIQMTLFPEAPFKPGQPLSVRLTLSSELDNTPLTADQLRDAHGQNIHLLLIDPALTDFHHLHAEPTETPGEYRFSFTPKSGYYRLWADITTASDNTPLLISADLGNPNAQSPLLAREDMLEVTQGSLRFRLSFDAPPSAGDVQQLTLSVSSLQDEPVDRLEPVMGAFGHLIGFYEDMSGIAYAYALDAPPLTEDVLGGPVLHFRVTPQRAGFIRFFAQLRVGGKNITVPFGITVAPKEAVAE